jgi:EmrB/QacA subfamily drug resistance transporter
MTTTADRRWLALPVLFTASFMAILDVFIVYVTAPSLQHDLGASPAAVQWVMDAYVLAYAAALITGGRVGDIIGRRRTLQIGVTAFALSSALCGAAPTPGTLIAARVVQGLSAALMWPQVLSIVQVEFAPHERRRCFAILGGVQGAASICGQIVGGGLIGLDVLGLGWRTVFLINVPIGLAAALAAARFVPESRATDARRLDLVGVALGSLAVLLVVAPVVEGREAGWPWWVPAALVAAAIVAMAWIAHERRLTARGGTPLVDLSLFALPDVRIGVALAFAFFTAVPCVFLILALYLQDGLGLSALASGVAYMPLALSFVGISLINPRLYARAGERLLAIGAAITALGTVAIIAAVAAGHPSHVTPALIAAFVLFGIGPGIVMPGMMTAVLRTVPERAAGSASGVLTTAQQIGAALGIAIGGVLFFGALGDGRGAGAYGDALAVALAWSIVAALATGLLALRLARGDRYREARWSSSRTSPTSSSAEARTGA